jgi:4-amino-4-deoxy-L-arabinose transferase-like glycosyltransferase
LERSAPWAVAAITAVAAVLRLVDLGGVAPNAFYDAAVRSMSLSFHNFLFGAFDPRAILSIDKPPLDLWLQVISVKLFGWGSFALKLPEAVAGTAAVPLLYDAVRRAVGRPAGLAAAAVLAIAPESVLTARSDTMDSVMMLLVVAALWLTIRACQEDRSRRLLVLAGVALGLAFNVKLLEAVFGIPALAVLYALAGRRDRAEKLIDLVWAGVAFVGVGLSWTIVVSLAPGSHPWAVGSTDGSVWNAMFVFNGIGRASTVAGATGGPGLFRLLVPSGWHFNQLFGSIVVAALALGIAAAAVSVWRERVASVRGPRLPRAFAVSIAVWIGVSLIVFDTAGTMHTRYMEGLSPALAIAVGYGAVVLAGLRDWRGRPAMPATWAMVVALIVVCLYAGGLHPDSIASGALALVIAAVGAARLVRVAGPGAAGAARWLTAFLIMACALTYPVHEAVLLVRTHANDSGGLATEKPSQTADLSAYLTPRTGGLRYEVAVDNPVALAPLIIRDQRAILPLTPSFGVHELISLPALQAAVAAGEVRYGLVARRHCGPDATGKAACTATALWIRRHGVDVSRRAGLTGSEHLYLLPRTRS